MMQRQEEDAYYYDDSSDEETINESVIEFNDKIASKWEDCKKNIKESKKVKTIFRHSKLKSMNDLISSYFYCSFIMSSAGINLLYHSQVNIHYYENKKDLLAFSLPEEISQEDFEAMALHLLRATLEAVVPALLSTYLCADKEGKKIDNVLQKELTEIIIQYVCNSKTKVLASEIADQPLLITRVFYNNENKLPFIENISDAVIESMLYVMEEKKLYFCQKQPLNRLFAPENFHLLCHFTQAALEVALPELCKIGILLKEKDKEENDKWVRVSLSDFPNERKLPEGAGQRFTQTTQKAFVRAVNLLRKGSDFKGGIEIDIRDGSLQGAYIADLIAMENEEERDRLIKKLIPRCPDLVQYIELTPVEFTDTIRTHFTSSFLKHLKAAKFFLRSALPQSFTLSSTNSLSFFANLRLSNRSQRREIRNFKQDPITASMHAKIGNVNAKNQSMVTKLNQRSWQFGTSFKATESQSILHNSLGRSDFVDAMGNYQAVYAAIEGLKIFLNKNNLEIEDGQIAIWIRDCLNCQPLTSPIKRSVLFHHRSRIQETIAGITYLIFGCEAARNPSSLIAGQMLLDLIIAKQPGYNWKYVLADNDEGGAFPMSPDNAVSAARILQKLYAKNLPYAYHYEGAEKPKKAWAVISRETTILTAWLSWKTQDADFLKNHPIDEVYKIILAAAAEWYNFLEKKNDNELRI